MTVLDELDQEVSNSITLSWNSRDGRVIPGTDEVQFGAAVKLDATILYADLIQSSRLATEFHQTTSARIIRSFLRCMARLIREHEGAVTAFDGDRVMGVFVGERKNSRAATCVLKMNYVVTKIISPKVTNHFTQLRETGFEVSHCVGIDSSNVFAIRAGQRGSDDLVWVGRAPNLAAKLSELRQENYRTFISESAFSVLSDEVKIYDNREIWKRMNWSYIGEPIIIYGSSWTWTP